MEIQPDKNLEEARVIVNYDEPPKLNPPSLSVGPIGWIRENLFGSPFDAILTVISATVIVVVSVGLFGWSIREANWLVVNQNFQGFMAGTYPPELLWRLNFLVYFVALLTGMTIAMYSRVGRDMLFVIGVGLAALFAVPAIAAAAIPAPHSFISAGVVDVQSGTVTESPSSILAFTGNGGTTVRVMLPPNLDSDPEAANLSGFADRPTNAYINAAANRLDDLNRVDEIKRILAAHEREPFLACSQFVNLKREWVSLYDDLAPLALNEDVAAFEVDDEALLSCSSTIALPETEYREITEVYSVNSAPVLVSVTDGESGEMLGEATLVEGEELSVPIATDGWYVLTTTVETPDTLVVLETINIYPLIERAISVQVTDETGEPVISDSTGRVQTETVSEYVNIYSRETLRTAPPTLTVDDEEITPTLFRLTDAKYAGERPLRDYMTLGIAPALNILNMPSLIFLAFASVGYVGIQNIKRVMPQVPGGGITNKMVMGGWGLFAFLLFLLSIGLPQLGGLGLGNVLALVVWVGVMFFLGMNYMSFGKSLGQPILGAALVALLGQLVYYRLTIDPRPMISDAGGWLFSVGFIIQLVLWMVIGLGAFQYGFSSENDLSEGTRRRGFFGAVALWVGLIIFTPLIINALAGAGVITNYRAERLLPLAEMGLWGGFLLTFMLTAVGIIASFPIGVLLALGRRAHRYPAIKYGCILYIEFVRGVPLVSVLFMASLLVPLVNPSLATVPGVIRAMVGITMFSAAYLAENVRGGLQSIPGGQEEAGKALGLNNVEVTLQIMLPQALRAVIPALVGQAISLFKDTSLVYIVGLADLTRVAIRVVAQAEFVGHRLETLTFISVIYFIFSYVMSFVSRRIEESGSGSARR